LASDVEAFFLGQRVKMVSPRNHMEPPYESRQENVSG
jgi:hypothetical protein